jgi:hypothetical protein
MGVIGAGDPDKGAMNDRPITRRPLAPCWRSLLGLALVVLLATACSDQADYPYYMEGSCSEAARGAACGTQAASGGEGVTENGYDFGRPGGTFTLTWEAYGVPDRFEVIYERKVLFDTGSVSG